MMRNTTRAVPQDERREAKDGNRDLTSSEIRMVANEPSPMLLTLMGSEQRSTPMSKELMAKKIPLM